MTEPLPLADLPFATSDEYMGEQPGIELEPCKCECACVGVRTDEQADGLCLACRHGYHTEDE